MNRLFELLREEAQAEGFPLFGGVDFDRAEPFFSAHRDRYERWVESGHHGAMSYLERGRERRASPSRLLPGARSIFCVARPYRRRPAGKTDSSQGPRYARYLEGPDYHDTISEALERVMQRVLSRCRTEGLAEPGYKVCVDTSAVLERSWAALAGLGWIGKNTLLIHPRLGSYIFLGEVLLSDPLELDPSPIPDLCGHCTRCLEGCPTQALTEPRWLDSRRCISYLTLEKRGEFEAPEEILSRMGTWVAGCDICQEVCPFNLKAVREEESQPEKSSEEQGAIALDLWAQLKSETESEYRKRVQGSALSRVKPEQFRRNLARALTNSGLESPAP